MKTIRLSGRGGVRGTLVQIKRWLLRLTAPPECRQIWQSLDGRRTRICDMHSSHLLNTIHLIKNRGPILLPKRARLLTGLEREARRRGLPVGHKPGWLLKHNKDFGEKALQDAKESGRAIRERRRQAQLDRFDREIERMFGPWEGRGGPY